MKRVVVLSMLAFVSAAMAAGSHQSTDQSRPVVSTFDSVVEIHGASIGSSRAGRDTVYVLGGPDRLDGTFGSPSGTPDWHGWTPLDLTDQGLHWQVSEFGAIDGNYSMWCGTFYEGGGDPGYGNNWDQYLTYTHTVGNPSQNIVVRWQADVQVDTEPEFDFVFMEVNRGGDWEALNADGQGWGYYGDGLFVFDDTFLFRNDDYTGENGDEIQLRVHFDSDLARSDQDDLFDTANGACRVDNLVVTFGGTTYEFENFEDGVSDNWVVSTEPFVGNYAALYVTLADEDPCHGNSSWQVAFVDTPDAVPETSTPGVSWRYGPGGYVVNNTGGLAGPEYMIENAIVSPYLTWPAGADAARLDWDVYHHEELGALDEWPGIFYEWRVRSTNSGEPTWLDDLPLVGNNLLMYGGPEYRRWSYVVTDKLVPDRTHFQVALVCREYDYGWTGNDGTPAPYFDNVQVVCYPFTGPAVSTRSMDVFNDSFPEAGVLDPDNLTGNNVRLDMARNIADRGAANDPGDSMCCNVSVVRADAVLEGPPKLFFRMKANPVFDGVRSNFAGIQDLVIADDVITGFIAGDSTWAAVEGGPPEIVPDRFNWDFPDSGFCFPGDQIRYYIEARDNQGGDIGTTILPADTSGFSSFVYDLQYDSDFIVRALPSMHSTIYGDQPEVLLWNDFGNFGGENEWLYAMDQLELVEGVHYDVYYTNAPSSGLGNGLGGRATAEVLGGYYTMLYTAGNLRSTSLSNGDPYFDAGDDIGVVTAWLEQGDRNLLMTGDNLVSHLLASGISGHAFVSTYLDVNYQSDDLQDWIGGQVAPLVRAIPGNQVIATPREWIANGGCPRINQFDAITVATGTERLAEFTDHDGNGGVYDYAGAIVHNNDADNADVVLFPYDFMYIANPPGYTPPDDLPDAPVRTILLRDILCDYFEACPIGGIPYVTPEAELSVDSYPNPFNPTTTIKLNLPRADEVSLKVFNVRGELVRTLVDGPLEAGLHAIDWSGETNHGSRAASGVYFAETRANGKVIVNKMALVK